jgi:hypothetical protein
MRGGFLLQTFCVPLIFFRRPTDLDDYTPVLGHLDLGLSGRSTSLFWVWAFLGVFRGGLCCFTALFYAILEHTEVTYLICRRPTDVFSE